MTLSSEPTDDDIRRAWGQLRRVVGVVRHPEITNLPVDSRTIVAAYKLAQSYAAERDAEACMKQTAHAFSKYLKRPDRPGAGQELKWPPTPEEAP